MTATSEQLGGGLDFNKHTESPVPVAEPETRAEAVAVAAAEASEILADGSSAGAEVRASQGATAANKVIKEKK